MINHHTFLRLAIVFLIFLQIVKNEMLYEDIKVCSDSERIDYSNSCKNNDESCLKDLEYIKNFQDFIDFYFTRNNQVYHSIDNVVYSQNCEITKQVILLFLIQFIL